MPPLLVLNSPGFTIWTTHFQRLVKLVQGAKGNLITVMKGNREYMLQPLFFPHDENTANKLRSKLLGLPTPRTTISSISSIPLSNPSA